MLALTLAACSESDPKKSPKDPSNLESFVSQNTAEAFTITVLGNDGDQPLKEAQVLIGQKAGEFADNTAKTGDQGTAVFNTWDKKAAVTVDVKGYIRATYLDLQPGSYTIKLRPAPADRKYEIKGITNGYGTLERDGYMHVGLVFPAMSRSELSNLQVTNLISTETDRMTVFGQSFDIPSNLSVPKQEQDYIFTVTLEKPQYRAFVRNTGKYQVAATRARFPFRETVDEIRGGKSFLDMINKMEFISSGAQTVNVGSGGASANLAVNQMVYKPTVNLKASKTTQDIRWLAVLLYKNSQNLYLPTDIKSIDQSGTYQMKGTGDVAKHLLAHAYRKMDNKETSGAKAEELSLVVVPANATKVAPAISFSSSPQVKSVREVSFKAPQVPQTLKGVVTFASLSQVKEIMSGKLKMEEKTPVWDVYSAGWTQKVDLPQMDMKSLSGKKRWELTYAAQDTDADMATNLTDAFENATHLSHAASDF